MNSSNKKLKKYAELLNDAAPKGEFLAFINPQESELLKRNGALGLLTDFGIPSYRNAYGGGGQYGGGGNTSGGGGEGNRESYGAGGQYGGGNDTGGEGNAAGQRALEAARVREQARIQSQKEAQKRAAEKAAAEERAARAREQAAVKASREKAARERAEQEAKQKEIQEATTTLTGRNPSKQFENIESISEQARQALEQQRQTAQRAISPSTDPKNKAISTLLNLTVFPGLGNLYANYLDATALGYSFQNPLSGFFGGSTTGTTGFDSFAGGGGDGGNGGGGQVSTPVAPVAPSNNLPPSMVNQYFANLNLGQALSSDLQTNYNNAKTNINSLLGITPPTQQFGYSTQPYGLLSSTNFASNPFNIDYLQQRGLI